MPILRKIRLIAAVVLLVATCLPLSECSRTDNTLPPPPSQTTLYQRLFPQDNSEFGYNYAIKYLLAGLMNPKDSGFAALTLIAFLWPLAVVILRRKPEPVRFWWLFYPGELLLCAGTSYWVYCCSWFAASRWLYGSYIAETAIALFACATTVSYTHLTLPTILLV